VTGGYGATSGDYTPTAPGTYLWLASYSGDDNNLDTTALCGEPGETSVVNQPGLRKAADREVQAPGGEVVYTVTASNTGDLPIKDAVIVDTLPDFVTPIAGSPSDGGTAVESAQGVWTITWIVDLPANDSIDLTYMVTIDADAPEVATLVNRVTLFDLEAEDTVTTPRVRELDTLVGECEDNAPYLFYEVTDAAPGELVTITFINPDGDNVVYSGLPLQGRVLWPGSAIDASGNPTDWPGWRFENGQWVEGDEFDWVRPTVKVTVETDGDPLSVARVLVGPLASIDRQAVTVGSQVAVTYPDATPICDAPPVDVEEPAEPTVVAGVKASGLPQTGGGGVLQLFGLAGALLMLGAMAVAAGRRRRVEL
jgi:uncharacterized repeat protein (TIGR01451 family)/LPXTG-motif cell wall-anchored protein